MKRNPKPFTVEIKKSRTFGQRPHLSPRRLFELVAVEPPKILRKDERQTWTEPVPARRILPSLVEPAWNHPEPVEPARRQRPSGAKAYQDLMELDVHATACESEDAVLAEMALISQVVSQRDLTSVGDQAARSIHEVQPQEAERAKAKTRKVRKKAPPAVEPVIASEPVSEAKQARELERIEPRPEKRARKVRPTWRQASAAQLPRHERWKRRLHPAAW